METFFQFIDNVEDAIVSMALRLRRYLTRRPKERRKVARTPMVNPQFRDPPQAGDGRDGPGDPDEN